MKNLEILKNELISNLENYHHQTPELKLIIKLVKGTDVNDPDFKEALIDEMAEPIINLLLDCYCTSDLLNWLSNNDYDIFNNYRYSEKIYLNDYNSLEELKEDNPMLFYDDNFDGLLCNYDETVFVYQW